MVALAFVLLGQCHRGLETLPRLVTLALQLAAQFG